MKRIEVEPSRVAYDDATDTLFVGLGDYNPTCIDHEVECGNGVFLQYSWPDEKLAFIEIWHFEENSWQFPVTIITPGPDAISIVIPEGEPFGEYAMA